MFIRDLNTQRFAGYGNWRMPTLEEAMSLMEPTRNFNKQYTDMLFDPKQASIWSSDRESSFWVWFVDFETGVCSYGADGKYYNCVRAVRSVQ